LSPSDCFFLSLSLSLYLFLSLLLCRSDTLSLCHSVILSLCLSLLLSLFFFFPLSLSLVLSQTWGDTGSDSSSCTMPMGILRNLRTRMVACPKTRFVNRMTMTMHGIMYRRFPACVFVCMSVRLDMARLYCTILSALLHYSLDSTPILSILGSNIVHSRLAQMQLAWHTRGGTLRTMQGQLIRMRGFIS